MDISGKKKNLDMINAKNILKEFKSSFGARYNAYESSIVSDNKSWFFLAKDRSKKYLFVIGSSKPFDLSELLEEFEGKAIGTIKIELVKM